MQRIRFLKNNAAARGYTSSVSSADSFPSRGSLLKLQTAAQPIIFLTVGEVASKLALRVNGDFAKQNHLAPPVSFIADFGPARLALQGVFCRQE